MILTFQIPHSGFSKTEHPRIMRAQSGYFDIHGSVLMKRGDTVNITDRVERARQYMFSICMRLYRFLVKIGDADDGNSAINEIEVTGDEVKIGDADDGNSLDGEDEKETINEIEVTGDEAKQAFFLASIFRYRFLEIDCVKPTSAGCEKGQMLHFSY
ncbi:hypothetical protein NQ318_021431 [Aromia moschata]|uniref:Uncharacterized protein n=1 Tax=Aromia moschata TaxID=1265417 RepID=A0AAV8ZBU2_9CUCU|nr:hypothetical protein NQ318_021431 [Aromia moschata]